KIGNGRLILSGSADYASTTVTGGTLQIGAGGTTGNLGTGPLNLTGGLEVNRSDTYTLSNSITGSGAISNTGAGTTIQDGDGSNFLGFISANAGTLILSGTAFPAQLTVNGAGVLRVANDNYGFLQPVVNVNPNNAQTGAL